MTRLPPGGIDTLAGGDGAPGARSGSTITEVR